MQRNVDLIALDLDDTLLGKDLRISDTNIRSIARARSAGIVVVPASGRNQYSMLGYAATLGLRVPGEWLICSNGAELVDAESGRTVESIALAPEFCRRVTEAIEGEGFPWQVYQEGVILCNRMTDWAVMDGAYTGQSVAVVSDREALFESDVVKFVIPGEPERIEVLRQHLVERFGAEANILTSKPYFLEILPLGADKSHALGRLAARLGIPMTRVMAVGDAMNDLGMIRAAGWGCAPANAVESVQQAARVVAPHSHDEDAVAWLIDEVALDAHQR
jgi:Cof subfamily protein (haloacid dehalogenase superfamily)